MPQTKCSRRLLHASAQVAVSWSVTVRRVDASCRRLATKPCTDPMVKIAADTHRRQLHIMADANALPSNTRPSLATRGEQAPLYARCCVCAQSTRQRFVQPLVHFAWWAQCAELHSAGTLIQHDSRPQEFSLSSLEHVLYAAFRDRPVLAQ